jgi:hypothetical protein
MPILPSPSSLEISKMYKTTALTPNPKQHHFGHLFFFFFKKRKNIKNKEKNWSGSSHPLAKMGWLDHPIFRQGGGWSHPYSRFGGGRTTPMAKGVAWPPPKAPPPPPPKKERKKEKKNGFRAFGGGQTTPKSMR